MTEIVWPERRAILELWRDEDDPRPGQSPVPPSVPNRAELYASANVLEDSAAMTEVLAACAAIAGEAGAAEMALPVPSDIVPDRGRLDVRDRSFRFAWLRKELS